MCEIKVGCSNATNCHCWVHSSVDSSIHHTLYMCCNFPNCYFWLVSWGVRCDEGWCKQIGLVDHSNLCLMLKRSLPTHIRYTIYISIGKKLTLSNEHYICIHINIHIYISMMFRKPLWTSLPLCTNVWFKRDMCYHFNICRVVSRRWPTHVLRKRCPNITGCIDK